MMDKVQMKCYSEKISPWYSKEYRYISVIPIIWYTYKLCRPIRDIKHRPHLFNRTRDLPEQAVPRRDWKCLLPGIVRTDQQQERGHHQ